MQLQEKKTCKANLPALTVLLKASCCIVAAICWLCGKRMMLTQTQQGQQEHPSQSPLDSVCWKHSMVIIGYALQPLQLQQDNIHDPGFWCFSKLIIMHTLGLTTALVSSDSHAHIQLLAWCILDASEIWSRCLAFTLHCGDYKGQDC